MRDAQGTPLSAACGGPLRRSLALATTQLRSGVRATPCGYCTQEVAAHALDVSRSRAWAPRCPLRRSRGESPAPYLTHAPATHVPMNPLSGDSTTLQEAPSSFAPQPSRQAHTSFAFASQYAQAS